MATGRPSIYTQELADEICARLAEGQSMRTVSKAEGMPSRQTMFRWIRENQLFCDQYAKAKEESADAMMEEMLDIADNASNDWMEANATEEDAAIYKMNGEHINRSRLRVDVRKWAASKLKPKKYGDKVEQNHTGDVGLTVTGKIKLVRPD